MNTTVVHIEWMCTNCGQRKMMAEHFGRPMPGTCAKASKLSNSKAHRWVKNRVFGKGK